MLSKDIRGPRQPNARQRQICREDGEYHTTVQVSTKEKISMHSTECLSEQEPVVRYRQKFGFDRDGDSTHYIAPMDLRTCIWNQIEHTLSTVGQRGSACLQYEC